MDEIIVQFLVQLPDQGLLWGFPILHLSARKFPQTRHRFSCWSLCKQNATIPINEGDSGNEKCFHDL